MTDRTASAGFRSRSADLPGTDKARRILAQRLKTTTDALELEFVLLRLRESKDIEDVAFATAKLAQLLINHNDDQAAAPFVAELEGRFGKIDCLQGKTGSEIAAALKKQRPNIVSAMADRSPWPNKRFIADSSTRSGRRSYTRTYSAEFLGDRGFFKNWTFNLTNNGRSLQASDGRGAVRWTLSFTGTNYSSYNYYNTTIRAHGHLLVVSLANRFMVLNTLGATTTRAPKVMWQRNLYQSSIGQARNQRIVARRMGRVGGRMKWIITDPYGNPLGKVGHVGNSAAGLPVRPHDVCDRPADW